MKILTHSCVILFSNSPEARVLLKSNQSKAILSFDIWYICSRNLDWFQIDLDDRKNIWTPTLYLGNAEHIQKSGSFGEESLIYLWYRSSTHMMHYSEIFKANVQCGMSFENFPFDSHVCLIGTWNMFSNSKGFSIFLAILL